MAQGSYSVRGGNEQPIQTIAEKSRGAKNYALFSWLYIFTQALGIGTISLVGFWMGFYKGGFGFQDKPKQEFRWHPLLMSTALLLINGEAMLIYRGFRSTPKKYTKPIHGVLQFCSFLILLLGLKAVLDSHDLNMNAKTGKPEPIVNFYSVHSWIGLLAVSLFSIQWVGGFVTFFKPGASMEFRRAVMPAHRLMGIVIFVCSLCAAMMGVAQLSAWSMKCWLDDKVICPEMLIANLFSVVLMGFAGTVLFLVANPSWIRQPLPSEM